MLATHRSTAWVALFESLQPVFFDAQPSDCGHGTDHHDYSHRRQKVMIHVQGTRTQDEDEQQ